MLSRRQHAHLTAGSSSWPELRTRKPAAGAPGPCSVTSRALARSARCTAKPMSLRHRQAPPPQCAATKIARPSRSERSHAGQGVARRAAGAPRTGAAERVAQRDHAAVGVDALLVQAQLLDAVSRLPPQRPRSARAPGRRAAAQGTTRAAARGSRARQVPSSRQSCTGRQPQHAWLGQLRCARCCCFPCLPMLCWSAARTACAAGLQSALAAHATCPGRPRPSARSGAAARRALQAEPYTLHLP